jgi:hypothetical protein
VSPEVETIFRVFLWSGAVALLCWLVVMALEAIPSFEEAGQARPGEEMPDTGSEAGETPSEH